MAKRGTEKPKEGVPIKKSNWHGKDFAKYANTLKKKADVFIHVGRGTGKVKLGDIADSKGKDNKGTYVSTGRGTKRVKRK